MNYANPEPMPLTHRSGSNYPRMIFFATDSKAECDFGGLPNDRKSGQDRDLTSRQPLNIPPRTWMNNIAKMKHKTITKNHTNT